MPTLSYFAIVTCRNSAKLIESAILSLQNQTAKPAFIVVVDDGSKDQTPTILKELQGRFANLEVITNPDLGYDVRRIVSNWNKALSHAILRCGELPACHLISTDDVLYNRDYAERILTAMAANPSLVIASGDYGNQNAKAPHGAGRFVSNAFFSGPYPERMGYESWICYKAMIEGKQCAVIPNAVFEHVRALGSDHHFVEFGASMRTLGYHPLFVLGRFMSYLAKGRPVNRIGALYMLKAYLTFKPQPHGYASLYDKETRQAIRQMQRQRLKLSARK